MAKRIQKSAIAVVGFVSLLATITNAQLDGYMDNDSLSRAANSIANESEHAWASTIGTSIDGQAIEVLTLAGSVDSAASRPGLLITAGIDGRYLVGSETAIRIAQIILDEHAEMLENMTIYIIPRVNPDGAKLNLESLTMGFQGNARVIDDDRDRAADEDGPDDINGDGYISMMRRLNPPIEDTPTHLVDPNDPRLNIKPDAKENQIARFSLYTEGIDNDGDGQINEDGFGYVDLDQNFMHDWPEYETHSGAYPLSEPETSALAKFVFDHQNIVMAITLGRHDNLVNSPESKKKNITGRAPVGIDVKDVELYKYVGELFKETTGQTTATKEDIAGSFHAWLYAQRGIPSFATTVWSRPELSSSESEVESVDQSDDAVEVESQLTPSGVGDISQETLDELMAAYEAFTGEPVDQSMMDSITPEMIEGFAAQAGVVVQRIPEEAPQTESAPKQGKKDKAKKKSEEGKWLEYFDQSGINGFIDWMPFDHPTLGEVEVGGFLNLAMINPPKDQLDELAKQQTAFVVRLLDARPQVTTVGPEIKKLSDGLYEIRFALVNDGEMPTSTMYSQTSHTIRPTVIRLSTDIDSIITGQRVSRVWGINPNGGRSDHHWIIRTDSIDKETIEIVDPRFGNQTIQLGN